MEKDEHPDWERLVKAGLLGIFGALIALASLAFLGKPSAPLMIVLHDGQELAIRGLGIIQRDQYQTLLDDPLLEHVAWSLKTCASKPDMSAFRAALGLDAHDHSIVAQGGLDWIARSPASEAKSRASDFQLKSDLGAVKKISIWKLDPRNWKVPVPLPDANSSNHIHIARIPHREAKSNKIGHVKPDADREAVWLKSITLPSEFDMSSNAVRALELAPEVSYSVGWLFVITRCHQCDRCELVPSPGDKVDCLAPETLTDHVLGMTHLVVQRSYLSPGETAAKADILKTGGLALLVGADYDYVPLRVSHYPAEGRQPFSGDETKASSKSETPPTKETTIAMLDERIHEILPKINLTKEGLKVGDLVLILPAELDFKLSPKDYVIVGLDDVPPPLRSHYRAGDDPKTTTKSFKKKIPGPILVGPTDQGRSPAARISAAVDE